jgi:hypothetical protein
LYLLANASCESRRNALKRDLTLVEIREEEEGAFYQLLDEGSFDVLIEYLYEQFENAGGLEKIDDVRYRLEGVKDVPRIRRLLSGFIALRKRRFWAELPHAKAGLVGNIANACRFKAEALGLLNEYFQSMHRLGLEEKAGLLKAEAVALFNEVPFEVAKPHGRKLDEAAFWALIDSARSDVTSSGHFAERLIRDLAGFQPPQIKRFETHLQSCVSELWSYDLWALAFIANGGCSDDSFDYFRAWVVSQGRLVYELALRDNRALAAALVPTWGLECEELLSVAQDAYLLRKGEPMPRVKTLPVLKKGEAWTEEELPNRYAELFVILSADGG